MHNFYKLIKYRDFIYTTNMQMYTSQTTKLQTCLALQILYFLNSVVKISDI